jgi:hypothetical protein
MEKINFLMLSFLVISCSCYSQHHISVDNLLSQFKDAGSEKHIFVKGNDLKTIKCFNKKEEEEIITITNRTGIRIFQNDGAKNFLLQYDYIKRQYNFRKQNTFFQCSS